MLTLFLRLPRVQAVWEGMPALRRRRDSGCSDLERMIEDNPNDPSTYEVYADFLQRAGDPRGDLIALALAESDAYDRHFYRHAAAFIGPIADRNYSAIEWRYGFIYQLHLGHASFDDRVPLLKEVLAHPSGRFLVDVGLGAYEPADLKKQITALLKRPPITLRVLEVGCSESLGDLQPLVDAFPRLERLELSSHDIVLPKLASDLVALRCFGDPLREAAMTTIAMRAWPRLERLELTFGDPDADYYGRAPSVATFEQVRPLLARRDLPALKHLALTRCVFAGAIVRALATSPLLGQLETLDLTDSVITGEDVAALATCSANLDELRLSLDGLSATSIEILQGLARDVQHCAIYRG